MRPYLFGPVIFIFGLLISQVHSDNQQIDNSFQKIDHGEDEYDTLPSDVLFNLRHKLNRVNEDGLPMDDVSYWESIYGTEDVPDFDNPPPIEGETIFMDLGNVMEEEDKEETVPIKRDTSKIESSVAQTATSMKQKEDSFEDLTRKNTATNDRLHSHFSSQISRRDSETSSASERYKESNHFYESGDSHSSILPSAFDKQEENVRGTEYDSSPLKLTASYNLNVDSEIEGELNPEEEFYSTLQSRSIKSNGGMDSVINAKRKMFQTKKDLINLAATGGSKAELNDAVHRTIEAKKDLIDSIIHSKNNALQEKKEAMQSFAAGLEHSHGHSSNIEMQTNVESLVKPVLNPKRKLILVEKDSIHGTAAEGTETKLSDAVVRKFEAKKGAVNSVLSGGEETRCSSSCRNRQKMSRISSSTRYQDSHHQSVVDSKRKIIQAKKDLIQAAVTRGVSSKAELSDAVVKTLDAKKDFIDAVISNRAEKIHDNDRKFDLTTYPARNIHKVTELGNGFASKVTTIKKNKNSVHSSLSTSNNVDMNGKIGTTVTASKCNHIKSNSCSMCKNVQINSQTFSNLESGSATSQTGADSSVNSGGINSGVTVKANTEFSTVINSGINTNTEAEKNIGIVTFSSGSNNEEIGEPKTPEIVKASSSETEASLISEEKIDTDTKDDSQLKHPECELGKCGITGKLYVDSLNENINQNQNVESKILTELELSQNSETHKNDEKASEFEIQEVITENEENNDQSKLEEEFVHSEVNEKDEKVLDDVHEYNEKIKKSNEEMTDDDEQTETIAVAKNADFEEDGVSSSSRIESHDPENIPEVIEENLEDNHRGGYEEIEDHQESGKLSHFQHFNKFSHQHSNEESEYHTTDKIFVDGHCRLINLDTNCTGDTAFLNSECQQLNTKLWQSQDSSWPITMRTVKMYLNEGQKLAIKMQNRAKQLCDIGLIPKLHTPAMLHLFNNLATVNTMEINHESEFSLFGTKLLQRKLSSDFDVTPNTFLKFLQNERLRVIGNGQCQIRQKRCPINQMYRSLDGSCNNRQNPTWGKTNTAFARVLPARYADGIHEPPKSVTGKELPLARILSTLCFSRRSIDDNKLTSAVPLWGQILSHDLAMQIIDQTVKGGIQCCADGKRPLPKKLQHHSCFPISIPADDKFYSKFQVTCMNFVRSMTVSREDCTLGPAEQLNTVSGYIDASPLYGSDQETCDRLRTFKGGRLLSSIRGRRELPPTTSNRSSFCDVMSPTEVCYFAGDIRNNQNPQLSVLQTLLLRDHNRIADEITILNPHWGDERIFQVTRQIVIAKYQHITYKEWLPLILGKKYCRKYRVTPGCSDKMSQDYDPQINAATINSFTTAAYRFFHTMVQGNVNLCPASRDTTHTLRLSNHYFRPQIIERNNNFDDILRGFVTQPMRKSDGNFTPELSGYLFRSTNQFGMDLESHDIQRGRDHGLQCYNAYRKICGLKEAKDFDDFNQEIAYEDIEKLKKFYDHVNDVDLFVGIVLEKKSCGTILGPTARCLIGEQFFRSRVGDSFFYANANQPHSFTQEQFNEIKKASLARLLCDNGDNVEEIQPQAFKLISADNSLTSCSNLPRVDLSAWKESKYY